MMGDRTVGVSSDLNHYILRDGPGNHQSQAAGVKSVPVFVISGQPYPINYGAAINELS